MALAARHRFPHDLDPGCSAPAVGTCCSPNWWPSGSRSPCSTWCTGTRHRAGCPGWPLWSARSSPQLCSRSPSRCTAGTSTLATLSRFSADANLGAVGLFVLWLYYTALVFLLGAVVAETWDLSEPPGRCRAQPPASPRVADDSGSAYTGGSGVRDRRPSIEASTRSLLTRSGHPRCVSSLRCSSFRPCCTARSSISLRGARTGPGAATGGAARLSGGAQQTMYHQQQQVLDKLMASAPDRVRTESIGRRPKGR